MMRVAVRADASVEIGTGHVMRCLTLAEALKRKGAEVLFVSREHPGHLCDEAAARGCIVTRMPVISEPHTDETTDDVDLPDHAHWLGASWKQDAEETGQAIGQVFGTTDWLIVDHYALDARWEAALRRHAKRLMVIDDLADRSHDCDLLLDQNLFSNADTRYAGKVPAHCGLMLGPHYALLQPEYAELRDRIPPRDGPIRRILVYFGGADVGNLTGMAIEAFLALGRSDIDLDVVVNVSSPYAKSIRQQTAGHANIHLHSDLPTLAPLMVRADFAIGAGGATTWERCCLGLPSLVITLADNQRPIAAELARQGMIRWLGHVGEVNESNLGHVLGELLKEGLQEAWSQNCRQLVDGQGTSRVCSLLTLSPNTPLQARPARLDDEALILQWANDPLVRQNAFSTEVINAATHRTWFRKRLRDVDHCRLYVVETPDGFPIGQVRFERSEDAWEISYSLDARCRGAGLAKPLLQTAMLKLRSTELGAIIFGKVKAGNRASRHVFDGLGFESKAATQGTGGGSLSIAVCSDAGSWINADVPRLLLDWLTAGHQVTWVHAAAELPDGDICFYLSYSQIVDGATRVRYQHNLVVHASDLPCGRGMSPMTWLVLEGKDRIPVTLLEAADLVDSGDIYMQVRFELTGTELIDELRAAVTKATFHLCREFVDQFPTSAAKRVPQKGNPTFYRRRFPKDSELNVAQSLATQFNLLRVVDNDHYPAWFNHKGSRYLLKIERADDSIGDSEIKLIRNPHHR
ncbi:MAG: UDP-2,4-diacetamido-2,4,6-trideoxy-beta-L-altropyranose hydrolase [bacterium]|uniref:UDP-2,4-diacetamido-2,4, 6-trideoxy-beta-L-altropyranose hydrolase n=1 Tax=Candidatus Methylomirabilis tolerans TaxID=3123416 RepID=A0AAJ1AIE5_9BACT|nr:UDP-2,4-diacetamido-2,4,6-trideoxy-beta-L-altropyranose hydrolase [Candidatus Methylomirabilis sp.]